jgi:hypothetical protein
MLAGKFYSRINLLRIELFDYFEMSRVHEDLI